jgi:hypothetical protein
MARMRELDAVKETELRSPLLAVAVAGAEEDCRNGRKAALARRGAGQERFVTARVYSGGGEGWEEEEKDGDAESGGDDEDADVDKRSAGSSSDDRS